ncbi:Tyrosine recombinase XerC [termite gut metagenome]|uniref:Tyrosine recombinase XerC n=1 Tax=termite gut metagenome TaxID=433724 RepID=A0A5J4RI23_9ZZZZ
MNCELKVSFYLKRERKEEKTNVGGSPLYPIVGKIIIGKTIAQFSTKLKVEERLWHVKSGRVAGKSHAATSLNREINKINLSIHTHYKEILERTGKVTASQVKNAFQGIASSQKTLIALFEEIMREFHSRIGIDRAASTYIQHEVLHKQLKSFLREKYQMEDIPLSELDLPFIEAFNYYLRVNRKMKPGTVRARIVLLNKVIRQALHRNFISRRPLKVLGWRNLKFKTAHSLPKNSTD